MSNVDPVALRFENAGGMVRVYMVRTERGIIGKETRVPGKLTITKDGAELQLDKAALWALAMDLKPLYE